MSKNVSIIIIAHTNNRTLPRALQAINLHSRSNDQKILVLNNPSPEVLKTSKELSSDWIIVSSTKPGPQNARNDGAKLAIHDYILFLDDDSELTKGAIDYLLTKFTSPYIALVQALIHYEKNSSFFWNFQRYNHLAFFLKLKKLSQPLCDTGAVLIKKDWFVALKGFNANLRFGEDVLFAQKIINNGGRIVAGYKIPIIQIYDEEEKLSNHLKKIKNSAPFTIKMRKILGSANTVELFQIFRKKIFLKQIKTPISYILLSIFLRIYVEICLNPYRNELSPLVNIRFKKNSKGKG